jgi:aryl-alcohol dehydrogenase-like predicted oxidoreductase
MSIVGDEMTSMMLGGTSRRVSRLGLGAVVWGDMSTVPRWNSQRIVYGPTSSADEQREALRASLAAGVNLIDTAPIYAKGASERRVGELTRGTDIMVATKFPMRYVSRAGHLPVALDNSLSRLERTAIDLYQVHFPLPWMSIPTVMNFMTDAFKAGKIRAVGVSNYSADQMRIAHDALARRGITLASNQVQYSLLHRKPEADGVLDACRDLGMTLIAYFPLASGALTGKYSATERPPGLRRYMKQFRRKNATMLARVVGLLREIGSGHGRTPSQIALRWLIQQENVLPIPGAMNGDQAAQNAGALHFTLSESECQALDTATRVQFERGR